MVRTKKDLEKEITLEQTEQIEEIIKLVTLDIGSFNIKIGSSDEVYENRFVQDNECEDPMCEKLQYNDDTFVFGKGKFDMTYGKAFKNIEVPVLYGLGKQKIKGNINLIVHLPSSQMSNKSMLVEKLQGKTFKYKVNGERSQSVTIKKLGVLKEGFSSFYALAKRNKGMICIVDIGGRTVDVFCFIDGVLTKEISIPLGTIIYFRKIAEKLTTTTGDLYEAEDIHPLLQNDGLDLDDYKDITDSIFKEIDNGMKELGSLKNYRLHLCGGGSEFFESNFKGIYGNKVSLMDNILTSNVEGAENIGKAKGMDK